MLINLVSLKAVNFQNNNFNKKNYAEETPDLKLHYPDHLIYLTSFKSEIILHWIPFTYNPSGKTPKYFDVVKKA